MNMVLRVYETDMVKAITAFALTGTSMVARSELWKIRAPMIGEKHSEGPETPMFVPSIFS